jgi:hypothetical protein
MNPVYLIKDKKVKDLKGNTVYTVDDNGYLKDSNNVVRYI